MSDVSDSNKKNKKSLPEYRIYHGMKTRCYNSNERGWSRYGGRGIKVCDEWLKDFWAFYNHVGPRPTAKHQIDRIDNDGNYEPGNVRWVLPKENVRNSRSVKWITHDDKTMTVGDWADHINMCPKSLSHRFSLGWDIDRSITQPIREKRKISFEGRALTVTEWAKELKIKRSLILLRLRRGWSVERTLTTPTGSNAGRWEKHTPK